MLMNIYQVVLREQQDLLVHGGVGGWQAATYQVELDEDGG